MSDKDVKQIYTYLGKTLRKLRLERGMTQEELARSLNLTRVSVSNLEAGRQGASIVLVLIISRIFQVPVVDLFEEKYRETFGGSIVPISPTIQITPDEVRQVLLERMAVRPVDDKDAAGFTFESVKPPTPAT